MSKQPDGQSHVVKRTSKTYAVNIAKMRVAPVHLTQRPFRPSWGKALANDLDLNKIGFPVLNHRDGIFWILDGQHRIFALKQNGFENDELFCEVYEDLTDQEAANLFIGRNNTKAVAPFDKFHVACTAGYPRETAIRRAVETQGAKVSRSQETGCIGAVTALGNVFDSAGGGQLGEVVLGQTVRTIMHAFNGDPLSFDSYMIRGLGNVFNRYNGKTNERHIQTALADVRNGVRGILQRAEAQRARTGNLKDQCVSAAIVDIYNKAIGPRGPRLPAWWKEA